MPDLQAFNRPRKFRERLGPPFDPARRRGALGRHRTTGRELRRVRARPDSREGAEAALKTGLVDLIAFGRPFIGNPDLPERLKNGWALTVADRSTYYTRRGEIGFTDFPCYAASRAGEH